MPLDIPTAIPPIGQQTEPDKVRVAAIVGGQLGSAPARGFGLTPEELAAIELLVTGGDTSDTPAEILAKLVTVDGAGSGLDSDTVDGQHAAAFEPVITAGSSAQYWRGDKTWQALPTSVGVTADARNRLINSSMTVSQENGTTVSPTAASLTTYYAADNWVPRWSVGAGTMRCISGASSSPAGGNHVNLTAVTPLASLGAANSAYIETFVEGKDIREFWWGTATAKPAVLRFWVRASTVTGTYCVRIANAPATHSFIATYSVPVINTWYEIVIPVPATAAGTWATDETRGLTLSWSMAMGSNFTGGAAGWQTGATAYATSAQVNGVGVAGVFYLAGAGLYVDPLNTGVAPPFVYPDEAAELAACQRLYYKTYANATNPGAVTGSGAHYMIVSGTVAACSPRWAVTMRTAPSVEQYSPVTGTSGVWRNINTATDGAVTPTTANQDGCYVTVTGTDVHRWYGHLVASARF